VYQRYTAKKAKTQYIFLIFWQKNIGEKNAHKMLMKLITAYTNYLFALLGTDLIKMLMKLTPYEKVIEILLMQKYKINK